MRILVLPKTDRRAARVSGFFACRFGVSDMGIRGESRAPNSSGFSADRCITAGQQRVRPTAVGTARRRATRNKRVPRQTERHESIATTSADPLLRRNWHRWLGSRSRASWCLHGRHAVFRGWSKRKHRRHVHGVVRDVPCRCWSRSVHACRDHPMDRTRAALRRCVAPDEEGGGAILWRRARARSSRRRAPQPSHRRSRRRP